VSEVTPSRGRYPTRRALYPAQAVPLRGRTVSESSLPVLSISLALRALAAARRVDPDVSTAAVEAALDAQLRERVPGPRPPAEPESP
jgi:hypothetical protein